MEARLTLLYQTYMFNNKNCPVFQPLSSPTEHCPRKIIDTK